MTSLRTLSLSLTAVASLLTFGGCDNDSNSQSFSEADRGPLGKADRAGSCMNQETDFCGGQSEDGCWCDEKCIEFGDCCNDVDTACGVDEPELICPDPADPAVEYVSENPGECATILFTCEEGQALFSNECGCGCVDAGALTCPDESDPAVHYVSENPLECAAILFSCEEGQGQFSNECGCGCVDEVEPDPACPDPNDPAVHYKSQDFLFCAAAFFVCEPGQELFSDTCGCGCIDL